MTLRLIFGNGNEAIHRNVISAELHSDGQFIRSWTWSYRPKGSRSTLNRIKTVQTSVNNSCGRDQRLVRVETIDEVKGV